MHLKGYHPTGIKDILKAAEVPRGSFYFYFYSKEAFGLEIIGLYVQDFVTEANQALAHNRENPLRGLKELLDLFVKHFDETGARLGCPIGNLALELGDIHEVFRRKLDEAMSALRRAIERFLTEAVRLNMLDPAINTVELAAFILDSWEGALVAMKAAGNTGPLRRHGRMIFERILPEPISGEQEPAGPA